MWKITKFFLDWVVDPAFDLVFTYRGDIASWLEGGLLLFGVVIFTAAAFYLLANSLWLPGIAVAVIAVVTLIGYIIHCRER